MGFTFFKIKQNVSITVFLPFLLHLNVYMCLYFFINICLEFAPMIS